MKITFVDMKSGDSLTEEQVEERAAQRAKNEDTDIDKDWGWSGDLVIRDGEIMVTWDKDYYGSFGGGIFTLFEINVRAVFSRD